MKWRSLIGVELTVERKWKSLGGVELTADKVGESQWGRIDSR